MATKRRIADLSATLSAETRDYEAGMKRAADATTRTKGTISQALGGIEKAGIKLGLGLVGAGGAMSLLTNEVRHVIENIEKIPGVPQTTIQSIHEARLAMAQTRQAIDQGIAAAIGWGSSAARGFGNFIGQLVYGKEAAEEAERAFAEEANRAAEASNRVADANRNEAIAARAAADAQLKHAESVSKFNSMMDAFESAKSRRDGAMQEYQRLGETDEEKSRRFTEEAAALMKKANAERLSGQETTESMNAEADALERLTEAQKIRNSQMDKFNQGTDGRVQSELDSFFGPLDAQSDAFFKNLDDDAAKAKQAAGELAAVLEDGFTQAIMEGRDFGDVLDGIGKSILNMVLQAAIIKPIANWIGSGITSFFGGFFADGGRPPLGKASVVGESGPELFVPDSAGTIVPNHKLGGGGNTYIIDARGTDESVVARLGQAIQRLAGPGVVERRALGAYSNHARRGGAFA